MRCAKKVSNLINHPVVCLFGTRVGKTRPYMIVYDLFWRDSVDNTTCVPSVPINEVPLSIIRFPLFFLTSFLSRQVFCEMMRVAVSLAALASASAFAPISAPTGLQLRVNNVARAPRAAGEPFLLFTFMFSSE
jgi:hypothetical protein